VCFEDHVVGHTACKLPCGHIFHPECVSEWLCKQASCPICRYEVETDDASYEVNRKKRMRERWDYPFLTHVYTNVLNHSYIQ
jgi:Tfp pilus assembly ATPase PilU